MASHHDIQLRQVKDDNTHIFIDIYCGSCNAWHDDGIVANPYEEVPILMFRDTVPLDVVMRAVQIFEQFLQERNAQAEKVAAETLSELLKN